MIKFIRNKETGMLEVWENNKKIGEVVTIGDEVTNNSGYAYGTKKKDDE